MFPPITNKGAKDVQLCINCGEVMDFEGDFCSEACQLEFLAGREELGGSDDDFPIDGRDE